MARGDVAAAPRASRKSASGSISAPSRARDRARPNDLPDGADLGHAAVWADPRKLRPWGKNPRRNDGEPVRAVMESIKRFGFGAPIVARKATREVIAGHTRLKAALKLGLSQVPVRYLDISERDAQTLALADNRLGELAEWDQEGLAELLQGMQPDEQLIAGWSGDDVHALLAEVSDAPEVIEDEVPEPPKVPVTQLGDVWVLGRHRLVCGDSTSEAVVVQCMQGERATCVFTDPPYGVSIGAKNRLLQSFGKHPRNLDDIKDDALSPEELKARLLLAFVLLRTHVLAEDASLFVTSPQGCGLSMMTMMMMMQEAGLRARHVLIWKKNQPTFSMGRLDYDYQHEPILFTWGKSHKRPMRGKHRTSIWEVDKPRASVEHPTMKPVELYANAYLNNSDDGDNVADIYAGSGTAFAAAEQLGRTCFGIELSPAYCDVIVERWQRLTGDKARRA